MAHLPYTKKHVTNYAATINRDIANSDMMEVVQMFNKKQAKKILDFATRLSLMEIIK